jgi:hypothetical protein
LTFKKLGAPDELQTSGALARGTPLQQLGYVDADRSPIQWQRPDDEDKQNLRFMLAGRQHAASEPPPRATVELERSVKLLPALTLEYARVGSLVPGLVGVAPDTLAAASSTDRPDVMRQAVEQFGDGVDLGKTVLRSIATVLAVDVAGDGDVDVIPALLNVFKSSTDTTATGGTAAAGAGAAIGGIGAAVVGVVAVGYLAYSAMRATRVHDEKARVVAHSMLMSIKEHHHQHFMRHFKQLMDQVKARLRQSLRERYRLNEQLMEKDRLAVSIGHVRSLQRDLLDQIGRSGHTLGLFEMDEAA